MTSKDTLKMLLAATIITSRSGMRKPKTGHDIHR